MGKRRRCAPRCVAPTQSTHKVTKATTNRLSRGEPQCTRCGQFCITRPHLSNDPMALVATNPGHTHLLGLIVVDRIRTLISHSSSQGVYAVITCLVAAASRRRTGARLPMRVAPQPRAKPRPPLPPYVRGSYSLDQTTPRPTVGQRRLCPLRWPLVVGPPAPPPPLAFCCPAIAISAPRSALRPPPPSSLPWPGDPRTRHL